MPQAAKSQPHNAPSSPAELPKPQAGTPPQARQEIPLKQRIPDSFFEAADFDCFPGIK